jgi:3',5'-cyclic AMP phosphodiesterase CpdA
MKLALFTDAHLPLRHTPHVFELLGKPLTGFLNWQKRKHHHSQFVLDKLAAEMQAANPDYFVFLGDMVNLGLAQEWETAKDFLAALCPPEKLIFLPGNHDYYTNKSVQRMEKTLSQTLGKINYPLIKEDETTRFIGLSTAIVTKPFNATGFIDAAQLKALEQALQTKKHRIIGLHHPPVDIEGGLAHKRLINLAAFQKIILKYGAEHIIHGHTHRASQHFIGATPVQGLPSASHIYTSQWLLLECHIKQA